MKKNKTIVDIGILIAVTIIAYFPVATFLFSLKNDSLVQYLPFRYHLSESIQHGYFPLWNPYLYTGFPIHADMQGMTWNPIVLIISLFTRYNMSVLELEVTIYLVLAAVGMYSLLKSFSLNRSACILGGIAYMSCGFINGSASVIPWISSAAFIPFVFRYFELFLDRQNLKHSLYFGISLSLLFLCGYPTFFIYTSYILLAILVYMIFVHRKNFRQVFNPKPLLLLLLAGVVFLLICSPAIISYLDFLPYYSRGSGITVAKAAENPFTPYSSISFLLPNAVHKDHIWLNTDTSMRNGYVGLFVLGLFGLFIISKKDRLQKLVLGITIFSFLLSLGSFTPLHKICYSILPGFNTFRHPGNIRLFTSIGMIMLAALYTKQLWQLSKEEIQKKLNIATYVLLGILLLPVIYSLVFQAGVISNITASLKAGQPKAILDSLRFPSMLLIQALLQLGFLALMIWQIRKNSRNKYFLPVLIAANSILFCWVALPFNFISQIRTKEVNQYVKSFPDGYPLPDLKASVEADVISDSTRIPIYGYPNFYSKKITIQDHIITPTLNKSYETYNSDHKLRKLMKGYPFAWLNDTIVYKIPDTINKKFSYACYAKREKWKDRTKGSLELLEFSPNKFVFKAVTDQITVLSLLQQSNFNWDVFVNGKKQFRVRVDHAFMGVPIPAGESIVEFHYKPTTVIIAAWISLTMIVFLIGFTLIYYFRKRKNES